MAKLAIKGHPTRGEEVIEILEMLGGINKLLLVGIGKGIYFINNCDNINYYNQPKDIIDDFTILTLEEFLEKYSYKVGDKAFAFGNKCTIIGAVWDESINEVVYTIKLDLSKYTTTKLSYQLQPYKEETMEVTKEFYNKYCIKCGSQRCTAEGDWLEGCRHYKEETMKELRIDFPEGYGYAGIENKQVIFTKIKPQYPKTYEECCDVLGLNNAEIKVLIHNIEHGEAELYRKFIELKRCREAYWKIAGEEMGLGKPWEPDWDNEDKRKYVITCQGNHIVKDLYYIKNTILAFPTEEMKDAFYENFKDLIEACKELL